MSVKLSSAVAETYEKIAVDTAAYLSVETPLHIKNRLVINLSDHSYLPRIDDLTSDWVAHVASPAFKLIRETAGRDLDSFCSIGTGSGLDVLAAVELLGATRVGLTDVHQDVVSTAADNVARNHIAGQPLVIESGFGDLLEPLRRYGSKFDLIYENLPNVPSVSAEDVASERKSSTHVPPRKETIPDFVKVQMLDLHYLALVQAKDFLTPSGVVLSTLGGRVPLDTFIKLGSAAGYDSSILTYTWKVQAVPEQVIADHAKLQQDGFGPFHFYHADFLQKNFADVDLARSGKDAFEIERSLLPHRLDAESAWKEFKNGAVIGHTVAVLKSEPR